ncbi:hypothetical protein JCGZ_07825 [Jatropha curcas]|uniref:Expansin-like EG45 domain-containing protein n=1 Tax=Jatropha curcas TaxID=180498 RepID=A0A067KR28_JATCU|nr:hypothetical protein JCGZ_07825 [Jatropha curcas]
MGKATKVLLLTLCLVGFVASVATEGNDIGTTTVYDPPYSHKPLKTTLLARVGDALWDEGDACGNMLIVRCERIGDASNRLCKENATVVTLIVDHCSNCKTTFEISVDAYAKLFDVVVVRGLVVSYDMINTLEG